MAAEEIIRVLNAHEKWLKNKLGGKRVDLSDANLDYSCVPLWYRVDECGKIVRSENETV